MKKPHINVQKLVTISGYVLPIAATAASATPANVQRNHFLYFRYFKNKVIICLLAVSYVLCSKTKAPDYENKWKDLGATFYPVPPKIYQTDLSTLKCGQPKVK